MISINNAYTLGYTYLKRDCIEAKKNCREFFLLISEQY